MRYSSFLALAAVATFLLLIMSWAAPVRASESTGCAEVCATVCKEALVDSCQDFICPEIPDCNVSCPEAPACPDLVCPEATVCPSAREIRLDFEKAGFARRYNICKVKHNGKRKCKRRYLVDALRPNAPEDSR